MRLVYFISNEFLTANRDACDYLELADTGQLLGSAIRRNSTETDQTKKKLEETLKLENIPKRHA